MILPIYTLGQPVLRKEAEEITAEYPELSALIENMFETMDKADGVGLAAPQIGLSIRLFVISLDCLSEEYPGLPGIHETVKRMNKVRVHYFDEQFQEHDEWIEGFFARVVQHEYDHLDGKVFVDRISALRRQLIKGKINALLKGKAHCEYKVKTVR